MTKDLRIRVNALLFSRIESLCRHLFPEGRKIGCSWRLGSVDINLQRGYWGDWDGSTPSMSRNLIDLWIYATHVDFVTAVNDVTRWLGIMENQLPEVPQVPQKPQPVPERKLVLPPLESPAVRI